MKIRRVKATPINYRLEAPYLWVFGELDGFSRTVVEVETEDGLVGIGEAPTPGAAAIMPPCNKYHDPEKPGTYRRLPLN
jgi:glucarate dehydratase